MVKTGWIKVRPYLADVSARLVVGEDRAEALFDFMAAFFESPLTDSNGRSLLTIEQRGGNGGHGREAAGTKVPQRRNRPKTSDLPWTPVPALVFPQGSLGYA